MVLVLVALGVVALQGRAVLAQVQGASCSTATWTDNDLGQSPCLVAAYLQAECNNGDWIVNPLPNLSQVYVGPTDPSKSNECTCSTVVYNLISACGACQGGEYSTWSRWATNCSSADISRGSFPEPIPSGTMVPQWAYIDTSLEGSWNEPEANTVAASDIPDHSAAPSTIVSTSSAISTSISTSSTPTPTSTGSGSSGSSTPVGAIVGGVVGGVAGLVILGLILFFCLRRRNAAARSRTTPDPLAPTSYTAAAYSPGNEKSSFLHSNGGGSAPYSPDVRGGGQSAAIAAVTGGTSTTEAGTISPSTTTTGINRYTLYDPNNPATWPGSPDAIYPSATPAPTYYSAASPAPHGLSPSPGALA